MLIRDGMLGRVYGVVLSPEKRGAQHGAEGETTGASDREETSEGVKLVAVHGGDPSTG
jgi:hypothetical protein